MSSRNGCTGRAAVLVLIAAVAALLVVPQVVAQETTPKAEIFAGYSYLAPGHTFGYVAPFTRNEPGATKGLGAAFTYNLSKHWGLTADYSGHVGNDGNYHTLMFGPKLRLPMERVTPFAEFLLGMSRFAPDTSLPSSNAFGLLAGGGLDLNISRRVSWRVIQADYLHGANEHKTFPGYSSNLDGGRVQTGLVFLFGGGPPPPPPSASCSANPTEVMAGEPVTVTANVMNWPPKKAQEFTWTAPGTKVEGKDATARVDTTGLAPGSYTVTANVTDHKKLSASCQAGFTVKEPPKHPPAVSCSANPTTVRAGTPSTITCECTSPDEGVQLSIGNWMASGGSISGSGNAATLDTAGASAGPISVTATCTDNRGLSATSAPVTVNVEVPPPPPQARDLGDIAFKKNSARVDNEAKGKLDQMADEIKADPNNKAVVIGYYDPAEKRGKKLAAQRAVNTKAYLTQEKGIDPNIIDVYTSDEGGMRAKVVLVPAGATYTGGGEKVDESMMKATKERAHHRAAKKKAAPTEEAPQ
jgi:outer membrane protein OmpA-like peptidoglycan-associated protein